RRQLAAVGGGDPGERNRHVVSQREVGLAGGLVLAPPQDLEHQLVGLIAVLAEQHIDALEGRGLQGLEAVAREYGAKRREGSLAPAVLGSEEVARARRRIELGW